MTYNNFKVRLNFLSKNTLIMQFKLTTFLLSICFSTSLFATTYRVNNTPGTDPDFDNLIDAHAIARDGDTLMIGGSNESYGELTMTKRLTLIGTGYFLDENPNVSVSLLAVIKFLTLNPTIDNNPSTGAAGSEIIGIAFNLGFSSRSMEINVNNVVIKKCNLSTVAIQGNTESDNPASGIQFIQNYFRGGFTTFRTPKVNIQVFNNIFNDRCFVGKNSSGAFLHNIFTILDAEGFVGEIRSNILLNTNPNAAVIPSLPNNQISHNIAAAGQFGDANDNFTTVVDNLFVGSTDNSTDGQWQLKPNSLASGNAHDGTDRGPFGGSTPYVLSGQGGSPAIIFFEAEPVGTASNRLNVRIRAKSSN